jgi:hydrogenase expression/formation protein HypD
MKFVDEFRDPALARALAASLAGISTRPWRLMEICGGQTHALLRHGIDRLLPANLELLHGPGCPVCVTPAEVLDQAFAIALTPGTVLCTFGDMLRVPGSGQLDLFAIRARGADVRPVYSPLDAVALARALPDRQVVFLAVGFETTAPASALAVREARDAGLANFSLLVAHVRVPPAIDALLSAPDNRVQGFLAAGHVCTVMGWREYEDLAARHRVPIVVTGFEPLDLLDGIRRCVAQLERGRATVENQYARAVTRDGNAVAQALLAEVFEVIDRPWRGLGVIAGGGLGLRAAWRDFDAASRYAAAAPPAATAADEPCRSGEVLRGVLKPPQCAAFGTRCTPEHPLGPTMVSGEGACAAYFRYRAPGEHADAVPAAAR